MSTPSHKLTLGLVWMALPIDRSGLWPAVPQATQFVGGITVDVRQALVWVCFGFWLWGLMIETSRLPYGAGEPS